MPLSWNEIKTRAALFANQWKDEVSEDAEAKSFWDVFFDVFGISHLTSGFGCKGFVSRCKPCPFICPQTMSPVLVKAHQALDKAVDVCYRPQPFINETKRIEFLFELYDNYTSGMFVKEKKSKT